MFLGIYDRVSPGSQDVHFKPERSHELPDAFDRALPRKRGPPTMTPGTARPRQQPGSNLNRAARGTGIGD